MKALKQIKPYRIIFLIILLAGNTFAWFIYTTKVDNRIDVHVKSWNVVFQADDEQVTSNIEVEISDVYPGMDDYEYNVTAYNMSEVPASLTYQLLEANILGTEYITVEGRADRHEQPNVNDLTSELLIERLQYDYPFIISFSVTNDVLEAESGEEDYTLSITWPFEQSNDEEDTRWGMMAASYMESSSNSSCITLKVKLIMTQNLS